MIKLYLLDDTFALSFFCNSCLFSLFFDFLTLCENECNLTGDGRIIRFSWAGYSGLGRLIFALRENLTEQPVLSKATSLLGKFLGTVAVDRL